MTRILLYLLLLTSLITTITAQDDEPLTIESNLVVINATITDAAGKSVSLGKTQFTILVDGKPQTLSFFGTEETPYAAVILLDTSGSMESRVALARSAAINFLDGLRGDDVVSILKFDSKVKQLQDFSNSRDIPESVYDIKAYGYTVLNDAIFEAAELLQQRPEKRRAIIVLSDGADTRSGRSADKALKAALAANATIYTVDMSSIDTGGSARMQNVGVLKNFAEKSGGRFIPTPGGNALREAFRDIAQELSVQFTLGYYPDESANDGKWHEIELKVSKPNLKIRTRQGFQLNKKN